MAPAHAINNRSIERKRSSHAIRGRTAAASTTVSRAAGIHTDAYTPPAANVTPARRTAISDGQIGAKERSSRVGLAVVVLVFITVVARVVVLVPDDIDAIEHRAKH